MKKKNNLFMFGAIAWACGSITGLLFTILDQFMKTGSPGVLLAVIFFGLVALGSYFAAVEYYNKVKEEIRG